MPYYRLTRNSELEDLVPRLIGFLSNLSAQQDSFQIVIPYSHALFHDDIWAIPQKLKEHGCRYLPKSMWLTTDDHNNRKLHLLLHPVGVHELAQLELDVSQRKITYSW